MDFEDFVVSGFYDGIVLDQTELATLRRVYFDTQLRSGLWLVNGPDHTPTALGEFTNRITVQESNFSGHVVCVVDDGGIAHTFINNNFEGCSNSFRLADQILFVAEYNEFENSTAENFITATTSLTGLSLADSTSISVRNNQASVPSTFNFFKTVAGVQRLDVSNNVLSNSLAASVEVGSGLVGNLTQIGNYNFASSNFQSGTPTTYFSLINNIFYRLKDIEIENSIVMDGGLSRIVNGGGTDAITWTNPSAPGNIVLSTNSTNRLVVSDTSAAITGSSGNALIVQDASADQGSLQLSTTNASYVIHGGNDYGGMDYRVPTGAEHVFRVNGSVVGEIDATGFVKSGVTIKPALPGTTGSIGGGALLAGACASGTVAVANSTTSMTVSVSPNTYPGDSVLFYGYVSSAGTVTVKVCGVIAVTPTSSTYNVRVIQ